MKILKYTTPVEKILITGIYVMSMFLAVSCEDSDACEYIICEESFNVVTDFEDQELGTTSDWQGVAARGISIVSRGPGKVLQALDGSGSSFAYTETLLPRNFLTAGCELRYDVEYFGGVNNAISAANSIIIYQGSINSGNTRAVFVLNSSSLINSGQPPVTIHVPLELATGTTLPSNTYGEWRLAGLTPPYTATDINLFNTILQNSDGLGFNLDSGGNPAEQWWYDNFTFKQCCSLTKNDGIVN
ncbi:hypothetical protein [Leeuwenhoekiella sp. H156]|uniref:hypothetical protein n=1 Tax=Leeuwenhoekiella sp. H156 TaxID=3450128 RepID=UPI003FA40F5D